SVEAAYLGKPVVTFDCGGVTEFLKPGMGVVVQKSRNATDLAAAMRQVMGGDVEFDPQLARARAARFDVALNVAAWEDILERNLSVLKQDSWAVQSQT